MGFVRCVCGRYCRWDIEHGRVVRVCSAGHVQEEVRRIHPGTPGFPEPPTVRKKHGQQRKRLAPPRPCSECGQPQPPRRAGQKPIYTCSERCKRQRWLRTMRETKAKAGAGNVRAV